MKVFSLILSLILLAGGIYGWTHRVAIVEGALSRATDLRIRLDDISLSPVGIKAKNVRVLGPAGSSFVKAFSAQSVEVRINPLSLLHSPTVIDQVNMENVDLALELFSWDGKDSNWSKLLQQNLMPAEAQPLTANAQGKEVETDSHQWILRQFTATKIHIRIKNNLTGMSAYELPVIPELKLSNLGQNGPLSSKEAVRELLQALLGTAGEDRSLKRALDKVIDRSKELLQKVWPNASQIKPATSK